MTDNREGIEIDLKQIILALLRRSWVILLVGILCAALAVGYAYFFVTPLYNASTQLYVNNTYGVNTPGFSSSQIMAAQDLADTYMVILQSRVVMDKVVKETGLDYTYDELRSMVSAEAVNETEVFQVTVTCADYRHAAQIANAIAKVLPDEVATVVEGSSVRVVDYAVESNQKVSPNYTKNALLGMIAGVVLSASVILVAEMLDNAIYDEDYLAQTYTEVPLLAVVPDVNQQKNYKYYKGYYAAEYKTRSPS